MSLCPRLGGDTSTPFADAITEVIAHLGKPGPVSFNGERFYVAVELKGFVDCVSCEHTDEEVALHVGCALDELERLEAAATASNRNLRVQFDSTEANLLAALSSDARWPGKRRGEQVEFGLSADFSDPTSTGLIENPKLNDYRGVDIDTVVVHPSWISHGHYQTFESAELEISMWMFAATAENFGAIDRLEPDYVVTGEAELMRRWLEY